MHPSLNQHVIAWLCAILGLTSIAFSQVPGSAVPLENRKCEFGFYDCAEDEYPCLYWYDWWQLGADPDERPETAFCEFCDGNFDLTAIDHCVFYPERQCTPNSTPTQYVACGDIYTSNCAWFLGAYRCYNGIYQGGCLIVLCDPNF